MPRQPDRQNQIIDDVRRRILAGEFAPGARVPTRSDFEQIFGVSPLTVQRAFDRLVAEGDIISRGRHGTFVSAYPPHLHQYWLVFPYDPLEGKSRIRHALIAEATHAAADGPDRFSVCVGHDGHVEDGKTYAQLCHDVATRRTAGLIFSCTRDCWDQSPLMTTAGVPRVALDHGFPRACRLPSVAFDRDAFAARALDWLHRRGRTRIAILAPSFLDQRALAGLLTGLAARGMTTRPYWLQYGSVTHPDTVRSLVHLLACGQQLERPDGLVITDDNLCPPAVQGLVAAGRRVSVDIDVVSHTNFPWPLPTVEPVMRLGYDVREVLQRCTALLGKQRDGRSIRIREAIPPVFEHELRNLTTAVS